MLKLAKPTPKELLAFTVTLEPLNKVCKPPLTADQIEVYFGLLCDLPAAAIAAAVIEIAASRPYPTWPMPGEIRAKATEFAAPTDLPVGEAWKLAWSAACSIDPANNSVYRGGGVLWDSYLDFRMAQLPACVAEAVRRFGGLKLLANSDGKFARDPFAKAYSEVMSIGNRQRLLPAAIKKQIADKGKVAMIGVEKS